MLIFNKRSEFQLEITSIIKVYVSLAHELFTNDIL